MEPQTKKRRVSRGICAVCGQEFGKNAMTRHLDKCLLAQGDAPPKIGRPSRVFHLRVEDCYQKEYWLDLEVPAKATLEDLDHFLRGIWLECCGHLSAFTIGQARYTSSATRGGANDEDDEEEEDEDDDFLNLGGWGLMLGRVKEHSMHAALSQVLPPGTAFTYEYDFGSTTELQGRVLGERKTQVSGKDIRVLARNTPPLIVCDDCDRPADWVGWIDGKDEPSELCDACVERNGYGDEMLLPVVNSPRCGVCGYTGPEEAE